MLALKAQHIIALVSSALSGGTLIAVALIGRSGKRGRAEIRSAVKAENGHDSLGGGLAAVEDRLIENRAILDTVEAKLDSHIEDTAPLVERAKKDWGVDGTKEAT